MLDKERPKRRESPQTQEDLVSVGNPDFIGSIKFFNREAGYGFILRNGKPDLYLHQDQRRRMQLPLTIEDGWIKPSFISSALSYDSMPGDPDHMVVFREGKGKDGRPRAVEWSLLPKDELVLLHIPEKPTHSVYRLPLANTNQEIYTFGPDQPSQSDEQKSHNSLVFKVNEHKGITVTNIRNKKAIPINMSNTFELVRCGSWEYLEPGYYIYDFNTEATEIVSPIGVKPKRVVVQTQDGSTVLSIPTKKGYLGLQRKDGRVLQYDDFTEPLAVPQDLGSQELTIGNLPEIETEEIRLKADGFLGDNPLLVSMYEKSDDKPENMGYLVKQVAWIRPWHIGSEALDKHGKVLFRYRATVSPGFGNVPEGFTLHIWDIPGRAQELFTYNKAEAQQNSLLIDISTPLLDKLDLPTEYDEYPVPDWPENLVLSTNEEQEIDALEQKPLFEQPTRFNPYHDLELIAAQFNPQRMRYDDTGKPVFKYPLLSTPNPIKVALDEHTLSQRINIMKIREVDRLDDVWNESRDLKKFRPVVEIFSQHIRGLQNLADSGLQVSNSLGLIKNIIETSQAIVDQIIIGSSLTEEQLNRLEQTITSIRDQVEATDRYEITFSNYEGMNKILFRTLTKLLLVADRLAYNALYENAAGQQPVALQQFADAMEKATGKTTENLVMQLVT